MHVTVLGATGGIGRSLVDELVARGHAVTAASRSAAQADWPAGVRALATDLTDRRQARAATQDAEVVVMAAQVPYTGWARELEPLFDASLAAAADAGARLVLVDNLYAYGSPGTPIGETTPEAATTRKGRLRARLGRRVLDAHEQGRVRATIGRFSDYYGPAGGNSLVDQLLIRPAVAGRTARTFIDATQPHTFHYLPDAARGFATLVERPEADGRTWILPAAPAATQQELVAWLGQALHRPPKVGHVSPRLLWTLGLVNGQLREAREVVPQFDRPYRIDAATFESTFGPIELTPHADAVTATVAAALGGTSQPA